MSDSFMTVTDVAGRLGVHRNTVLHWIRAGELDAVHVGRSPDAKHASYRISPEAFEEFCLRRRARGPRETPTLKGRPKGWRPTSYV